MSRSFKNNNKQELELRMNKQKRENIIFIVKCQLISSIEIGTVEFEKKTNLVNIIIIFF